MIAEALISQTPSWQPLPNSHAPTSDWRAAQPCNHFVQFYENDSSLVESVSEYIASGLTSGCACIAITTPAHRLAIEERVRELRIGFAEEPSRGEYVLLDAEETLACFMQNGVPDSRLFENSVGRVIAGLAEGGRPVRAFGEMVAVLWSQGNQSAAIRLEELWNILAKTHKFSLFCAYSMSGFSGEGLSAQFNEICSQHSHVIPAESYAAVNDTDERLREITRLQQKASELEAEILRRKAVERTLFEQQKEVLALNARLKRAITEMHHRVKNNLQVMSAMIEMQELEYTGKRAVPIKEFGRLKSHVNTLAIVHDLLTTTNQESGDDTLISIKAVLSELLPMLEETAWKQQVHFAVAQAFLPSKQCVALSLVVNELVTNGLKHGKNNVELTLSAYEGEVVLEVCDDGPGFQEGFSALACAHTGLELVASLVVTDLHGESFYENRIEGGARVRVVFALPEIIQ